MTELAIEDIRKRDISQLRQWVEAFFDSIELPSVKEYLNSSDFYVAPGSTRFHDNVESGLVMHSLATGWVLSRLAASLDVPNKSIHTVSGIPLTRSQVAFLLGIIHDFCKIDMYVVDYRNVKVDGNWTKQPYYKVSDTYVSLGHGIESWHRFQQCLKQNVSDVSEYDTLMYPVVYHMGTTDLAPMQESSYARICCMDPWVDLLHMADKLAADHLEATWLK